MQTDLTHLFLCENSLQKTGKSRIINECGMSLYALGFGCVVPELTAKVLAHFRRCRMLFYYQNFLRPQNILRRFKYITLFPFLQGLI